MADVNEEQRFTHVMLTVLSSCVQHAITRKELFNGCYRTEMFAPMTQDALVLRLQQHLLSQSRIFETRYPRDWWEAVKARFAPAWFVRRYPVLHTVWRMDARRVWENAPSIDKWGTEHAFVISAQSEFPEDNDYRPEEFYS